MRNHHYRPPRTPRGIKLLSACILLCLLPLRSFGAEAEPTRQTSTDFLIGYISAILEQDISIDRDSYTLEINEGNVIVYLEHEVRDKEFSVNYRLRNLEDVASLKVIIVEPETPVEEDAPLGKLLTNVLGFSSTRLPFPYGNPFQPLLADPKQPKFFVSAQRYRTPTDTFRAASVGYGETFGIYRRAGQHPGDGLQVSISGGLFALFNLDAPSHDLINADYTIGFPVTYRKGDTSARLRIYHQSSHLGDEFLLRTRPERINLSYESLELLVSQDFNNFRGYMGGEFLLRKDPSDLKRLLFHSGFEYRGSREILDAGHLIAGIDLKSWEENDWYVNKSAKVGLEIGKPDPSQRNAALMLEYYQGFAPHGQFYDERISYYGAGIYISF